MDGWLLIVAVVVGLAIGAAVAAWLLGRGNRLALEAALASAGADAQVRLATAHAQRVAGEADVRDLQQRLAAALAEGKGALQSLADERVARARVEAELGEEREQADQKLAVLGRARDELSGHFKALAGEALEANHRRMAEQHHGSLDDLLKPLGEKIAAFGRRVDETYEKETVQRALLQQQVINLHEATARINQDAVNLTRALKGEAKTRGNWGELVLERVLERSGLVKGVEYETQFTLRDADGGVSRPDVVVRLPDDKHIVIDSKVSLVAYERYYAAGDDEARLAAGRQHVDAVRKHARDLGGKEYQRRDRLDTPDLVVMFVPVEPALGLASSLDESLFIDAWDRRVVIVTPSTLLAVLATVHSLWQREKQTRNAIEIAERAGALHDQFALVLESLDHLGTQLDKASRAFDATRRRLSTGQGNLVGRVEQLREMGAKATKQLPAAWTDRADDPGREETPDAPASGVSKLVLVTPPDADSAPR